MTRPDDSLTRVVLRHGTMRLRALCDALDTGEVHLEGRIRQTVHTSARGRALRGTHGGPHAQSFTAQVVAKLREAPRTFAELRTLFPQARPQKLSLALNHARHKGLVTKRGRARSAPWRATAA